MKMNYYFFCFQFLFFSEAKYYSFNRAILQMIEEQINGLVSI